MKRRFSGTLLTGALAVLIAFGSSSVTTYAEGDETAQITAEEQMDSVAAASLTYSYDATTKTATITGKQNITRAATAVRSDLPADTQTILVKDAELTGSLHYLFAELTNLKTIRFENSKLTDIVSLAGMFKNCRQLTTVNLACFNTVKVKSMEAMFDGCSALQSVDIRNLYMINCTEYQYMFRGCSSLRKIEFTQADPFYEPQADMFAGTSAEIILPCTTDMGKLYAKTFRNLTAKSKVVVPYTVYNIESNGLGYTQKSGTTSYEKIPGFVVYGYTWGIEEKEYAEDNGFSYVAVNKESDLLAISYPASIKATVNENIHLYVSVDYPDDATYQWQKYINGSWQNMVAASAKSEYLQLTVTPGMNYMKIRCAVSNSKGERTYTGETVLEVTGILEVKTQPSDVTTTTTKRVTLFAEANDALAAYQWQKSTDGGKTWVNSSSAGANAKTLYLDVTPKYDGYKFRCKITDQKGQTVYTRAATLRVAAIVTQPASVLVTDGQTAVFKVAATGANIRYQWQKSTDGGKTWENSSSTGAATATLSISAKRSYSEMKIRCVVTASGIQLVSEAATLSVNPKTSITSQPVAQTTTEGYSAIFKLTAIGAAKTYQWQKSTDGGQTWTNSTSTGAKTSSLTIASKIEYNGYKFRCKVTGADRTVYSNAVTLTVRRKLAITTQPTAKTVTEGAKAIFKVAAYGDGLKYQWQKSSDGTNWNNSSMDGATTASLTVETKASYSGLRFRCIVTDKYGKTVTSSAVKLTVNAATAITTQPVSKTVGEDGSVTFKVAAAGTNLKYQWQKSTDGGATWVNSSSTGAATASLSLTAKLDYNGYKFRCKVTGSDKTVTSNAATLTVQQKITITSQPAAKTVTEGTNAVFQIAATGAGLKYQWQKSNDGGATWSNSSMDGAATTKLTVTTKANLNGFMFRCVVTDKYGKNQNSASAKLTVNAAVSITTQPTSKTVTAGSNATFKVAATGSKLTYQWQKSSDGGKTWSNSSMDGATTATLTVATKATLNGFQFRCKISDGVNTKYTNAVTLTVK